MTQQPKGPEGLSCERLKEELKECLTKQTAPIYQWTVQNQTINLYDICDEFILSFEVNHVDLTQVDIETLKVAMTTVLTELEAENYLTLEEANPPLEVETLEPSFSATWDWSYLDELPISYHEEDADLEEYCL